jgi:hypothetical protein
LTAATAVLEVIAAAPDRTACRCGKDKLTCGGGGDDKGVGGGGKDKAKGCEEGKP